jgi:O-antigen/teichoic acid export membrane protein
MKNLGNRVAAGVVWAMLYKGVERGLGLISTLILARLLVPEDFGLVAMAGAIVAFMDMVRFFGFDASLIQRRDATKEHFDTVWTFAAVLGIATALVLVVAAPLIADYFVDPRLKAVLWALALAALFNGLESNGPVAFRKELQWRQDFLFQASRKVAAVIFTIPLAFLWRNYWALIVGTVVGRFASMVISYMITPHRPRFTLAKKDDLWHFSKWMLIVNLLNLLRQRLPSLMLGKLVTPTAVGYFTLARDVTRLPTTELAAPINRAAFPGYAKIANNMPRLQGGFLKLLGAMALIMMPAGVGIALTAELIVRVFLGEKWLPAVPSFQILGIYGMIAGLQSNSYAIYLALGRPRLQAVMLVLFVAVLLPATAWLAPEYGHSGAAAAYLLASLVAVPANLINICSLLGIPLQRLGSVLVRPALGCIAMAIVVWMVNSVVPPPTGFSAALLLLIGQVVVGATVYAATVTLGWHAAGRPDGAERWVLNNIGQRLRRRGARA